MTKKYVYLFNDADGSMKELLGGKGANLAQMKKLGMPVPDGFTVTTEACTYYNSNSKTLSEDIIKQIDENIKKLEVITTKKFGDTKNPLLVSVRSGSRASMPGMMDTVLNLGLNDEAVEGMAKTFDNEHFAYDSYRRFIMMFSDVVIGVSKHKFDRVLDEYKQKVGVKVDKDLSVDDLKYIVKEFKKIYRDDQNEDFPSNARDQLLKAICAVFDSWDNERAFVYRRMHDIPYDWGTAVNVQAMVFGNKNDNSGTGVVFTRNPANGDNEIYGEYMMNAQGEDVVAGVRTPKPFIELSKEKPEIYKEYLGYAKALEHYYKDMQDMEITIEDDKLYVLQTRNGKRTAAAAIKIAVDLVAEGLITKEEAVMMIKPKDLDQLLHPDFDKEALAEATKIAKGLPASPGAAAGKVCFNAKDAEEEKAKGERVILVRLETSPEDIVGMSVSEGILTVRGGMTSHAAVVARGMGRCCVSGCEEIKINEQEKYFIVNDKTYVEGDYISLDGSSGKVYEGDILTTAPAITGNFEKFMSWADELRTMGVRTNADTKKDALKAIEFGAEGIGLTRTEHMFFDEERIFDFRQMILSDEESDRIEKLEKLLPYQRQDFIELYEAMGEKPVTIRLIDPPLHEFLPKEEKDFEDLAKAMDKPLVHIIERATKLHEINPMMGHRGCRLCISYPEIAVMQTKAIIEAAISVSKNKGIEIKPEIMIPLVGEIKELKFVKELITKTADEIIAKNDIKLKYLIGTMIEIPRAALLADEIAKEAEFFSFGTNDLTQLTYGLSRDDAGIILKDYIKKGIYEVDPTQRLDQSGVGQLVEMAVIKGKSVNKNIKLGICGEHGGDPSSIEFCQRIGLSYVSCSPYRVPIARLAAAQAAVLNKRV